MASKRWDRGRRTRSGGALDIQGTLGTLLRTTLHQMGVVKEAVERQARSSLGQLDTAKLQRRRREALARLGEVVWEMAVNGELGELAERSEIAALLDEIEELEASAGEGGEPGEEPGEEDDGAVSSAGWKPPAPGAHARGRRHHDTMRVWRPNLDDHHEPPRDSDPSTATARDHEPPAGRAVARKPEASADARPEASADARPEVSADARPEARADARPATSAAATEPEPASRGRSRRSRQRDDGRTGGIAFMEDGPGDDDDLSQYTNDDDVPRRK